MLEFDNPNADHYTLKVLTGVENTAGLPLAQVYTTDFQAVSDFSPFVNISFTAGRANNVTHTVSYNVVITNKTAYNLIVPLILYVDALQPADASVVGGMRNAPDGQWWLDLSGSTPGKVLIPGGSTVTQTFTISNPSGLQAQLQVRHLRHALCQRRAGLQLDAGHDRDRRPGVSYTGQRLRPQRRPVSYVLDSGPAGMTINATTGLISWTPTPGSPAQANVVVVAYNVRGGHATQTFTIAVSGVNQPPVFDTLGRPVPGQEGQALQVPVHATDPEGDPLIYWANNLPAGAVFDPRRKS